MLDSGLTLDRRHRSAQGLCGVLLSRSYPSPARLLCHRLRPRLPARQALGLCSHRTVNEVSYASVRVARCAPPERVVSDRLPQVIGAAVSGLLDEGEPLSLGEETLGEAELLP